MDCFRISISNTYNIFNKMSIDSVDLGLFMLLSSVFFNFITLWWFFCCESCCWFIHLMHKGCDLIFLLVIPHHCCHLCWFLRQFNRWIMDMECSARCACKPSCVPHQRWSAGNMLKQSTRNLISTHASPILKNDN